MVFMCSFHVILLLKVAPKYFALVTCSDSCPCRAYSNLMGFLLRLMESTLHLSGWTPYPTFAQNVQVPEGNLVAAWHPHLISLWGMIWYHLQIIYRSSRVHLGCNLCIVGTKLGKGPSLGVHLIPQEHHWNFLPRPLRIVYAWREKLEGGDNSEQVWGAADHLKDL